MRTVSLATAMFASTLISGSVIAKTDQLAGSTNAATTGAPIIQVQPRAEDFSANSPANEAEQQRLSTFDAKQEKLDEALDRKLNICRC
jgi:hypothetical protein